MGERASSSAGDLSGRFTLERELGSGASGTVYRAYDSQRRTDVALKLLRSIDGAALIRFKREFRSLVDIVDPHLVTLYELGSIGETWFLTMELIAGGPMIDYVRPYRHLLPATGAGDLLTATMPADFDSRTPDTRATAESFSQSDHSSTNLFRALRRQAIREAVIDEKRLRSCFGQMTRGLLRLHRAGKLHCDLKPSNVLVDANGRAVLCDFGLVSEVEYEQVRSRRSIRGTPGYMSPEQAVGKSLGESTDWYSAGVMLYEALTGQLPFSGSPSAVLRAKTSMDAKPVLELAPGADRELAALCDRLLHRDPYERATGTDIARALELEVDEDDALRLPARRQLFVGRKAQLTQLDTALEESRDHCAVTFVVGPSGMGKSSLCRRFIDDALDGGTAVISGRCYERESVPHEALDALTDDLCSYLTDLDDVDADDILADDAGLVARLFPAFGRFDSDARGAPPDDDDQAIRRIAFEALTRILRRLAVRRPTILFVNDIQWGDLDSATFFSGLVHHPEVVPILMLATCRSDLIDSSQLVLALVGDESPHFVAPRMIAVDSLSDEESTRLARLMGRTESDSVSALVAEAGGHPLFLTELARAQADSGAVDETLQLDELLQRRVSRLPEEAQALLSASALAARPMPVDLLSQAAQIRDEPAAVAALLSARMVRSSIRGETEHLEPYHDRIRHAVAAMIDDQERRHWHRRIARALEWSKEIEPIALVEHWLAAGEPARAAGYATAAAKRAEQRMAFWQSAQYQRISIELLPLSPGQLVSAWSHLAETLVKAGAPTDAAGAFQQAAHHAPEELATPLLGQAASELIRAGKIDDGLAVAKEVLDRVGLALPESNGRIIASILARRAWLKLRGLRFRERDEADRPATLLHKFDAVHSLTSGLSFVLPIHGAYLQLRQLDWALASGDPYRVALAIHLEVGFRSLAGARNRRQVDRLVDQAQALGRQLGSDGVLGVSLAGRGLSCFLAGEFGQACDDIERGEVLLRGAHGFGLRWQRAVAAIYRESAAIYLGRLRSAAERIPLLVQQALENGDEYSARGLCSWRPNIAWLVRDDVDEALAQAQAGAPHSLADTFTVQHYYELLTRTRIDLYSGAIDDAWRRVDAGFAALNKTMHLRLQSIRVEGRFLQGRAAVAAAAQAGSRSRADELRSVALRCAKLLRKEKIDWAVAKAALLHATVARQRGDDDTAALMLERAIDGFHRAEMRIHREVASLRLGQLMGGDRGAQRIAAARQTLADESVAAPDKFAALYAPGWS